MPKSILTISTSKYLAGHDVADVMKEDWKLKATPQQQQAFDNRGFNLDPASVENTLEGLKVELQAKAFDGVIIGWCTRGNKEFTVWFERVVSLVVEEKLRQEKHGLLEGGGSLKMMFSEGPADLVNTTLRTFGQFV